MLLSFRVWSWLWGKILPVPRLIFKVMLSFISDSAPYINALALLKAVRAEPLILNSEWGVLLTDCTWALLFSSAENISTQPCWPGWVQSSAQGFSTGQERLRSSVPLEKLGRCGWRSDFSAYCMAENFEMLMFLNPRLTNTPECSLLWGCSLVFCHWRNCSDFL